MKADNTHSNILTRAILSVLMLSGGLALADDLYLNGGIFAEIDSTINGSVFIDDATVHMLDNAHIMGFVVTSSGAVLGIYGGQIDYMLLISTADPSLPEGLVTIYGTDFAVDGVPVDPATTELFLQGQVLSGVYASGTPFAIVVDCAISGNANNIYYQTIKLGWLASQPDIALSQTACDFGSVEIGTAAACTATISNVGNAALTILSLALTQDSLMQFGITPWQVLPVTLAPNESIDIEFLFGPVAEGPAQAVVHIASSDPDNPVVDIVLTGQGIPAQLTPQQQIAAIADFYALAIDDGTLYGVGKGKSAANKAETFEKMIGLAADLIGAGQTAEALDALCMIAAKCDGLKSPADFVEGTAAAALHAMITDLIDALRR
ncbi:MAG TPA: choice-of-anchor D domain-containing protein [Anaerohalosphaeraceae bacterium]|nr:choice-of-anchor D domain-containing protein [Anaerohalosphaeraceae bacterium]HOL31829.1 choice-of-anchor D domain-containing protein [Anaerohalosphaeraceae bacterium]HOM77002.1 choice-of-anchor D domain-containing protein [Anaerohalosphaeraceae bacterium]HPC65148.1 choice-of-anchor D domain-containing protein [Anaerohalosphaeraceae bacterium]HPO70954.1 choice-of-anchor D domain-containing protein [Anaerohalosphaeraceae bacterium]